jgi:hypothetical protein
MAGDAALLKHASKVPEGSGSGRVESLSIYLEHRHGRACQLEGFAHIRAATLTMSDTTIPPFSFQP